MWVLLWTGLTSASAQSQAHAPEDTVASMQAKGYVLDKSDSTMYFFRVRTDSTVYLRRGRSGSDTLSLPASTLATIYESTREYGLGDKPLNREISLSYENQILEFMVAERVSLIILSFLFLFVVAISGLVGWLWWQLSHEQRRSESLDQSRRLLAEGREKERQRLAREIHDGPVQDLHGLHMHLTTLKDEEENGERIEGIEDELMRVVRELRSMSADLHPPALQQFGLVAALRSHADRLQFRDSGDSTIHVESNGEVNGEMDELSQSSALALFRIGQEAMNNAVQHAEANQIAVDLQRSDDTITIEVRDDGQGFVPPDDWHEKAEEESYGLLSMKERADAIGATINFDTAPGAGTHIRVSYLLSSESSLSKVPASASV